MRRERLAALVREKLPLFLLVGISAGITLYAQWTGGSVRSLDKVTLSYRVGNALISTVEYCRKLIWPSDLTVFYPHRTPGIARLCFCAAFFATVTGVAAWQYRARPQVLVGWLWFLIMLLPVCGLIQVGDQALADRYTYLPSIGLCIGVAWTLGEIASGWRYRRLLVFASTALVLALFITLTERQLGHWHDSLALWRHAIDIGEPSVLAYQKLGMAYLDQGAQADAIENFEQALRLDADDPTTLCNLGGAYVQRGDVDIGLRHLRRAVRVDPANINAWYNLGVLASKDHHPELARTYYERALAVKPDYWPAHLNLGLDALTQNDAGRALGHLHEAAAINPLSAQAICFLGVAHEYLGQTNDALRCYQEAARLNPQLTIAAQRLARVESRQLAKEPGK